MEAVTSGGSSIGRGRGGLQGYWRARGAYKGSDGPHFQQHKQKRKYRSVKLGGGRRWQGMVIRIKNSYMRVISRVVKSRVRGDGEGVPKIKHFDAKNVARMHKPRPVVLPTLFSFF